MVENETQTLGDSWSESEVKPFILSIVQELFILH